jgi:ABC-type branched-subunit amino acid transport system substrate-binding protein
VRAGLSAWARDAGRELRLEDDGSDPSRAARIHRDLVTAGLYPVLGPYGSDTTRAVAQARAGPVVWNHGAAADDVQRLPGVVSVATPASRYLVAVARAAAHLGAERIAVLTAPGRFARLAREGLEREIATVPQAEADCVLLCGPVDWEAVRFRELAGHGVLLAGISPGLPSAAQVWPDGTLAPVQWHPDLGGPAGVLDYVAAQAYAAALIASECPDADAVRRFRTETFFGRFALDDTGLQVGHELSVVRWRAGRQELLRFA